MAEVQLMPVSFSEAVLLRPMMYTLNSAFGEVIAFVERYFSGAAHSSPYAPPVTEWQAFRVWLAAQFCVDTAKVFSAFQTRYGSDRAALTELSERLARFREATTF